MALSKGFRNAPKLYGDDTVRAEPERITGLQSGLKAAGKEFSHGFYDGITGLVTQPSRGAEKEGAAGFVKGFAKGVGGLICKPAAGAYGIPGYAAKGVHAEINRWFGGDAGGGGGGSGVGGGGRTTRYIAAARMAQGRHEATATALSSPAAFEQQTKEIIDGWQKRQREVERINHGDQYTQKPSLPLRKDNSTAVQDMGTETEIERESETYQDPLLRREKDELSEALKRSLVEQ